MEEAFKDSIRAGNGARALIEWLFALSHASAFCRFSSLPHASLSWLPRRNPSNETTTTHGHVGARPRGSAGVVEDVVAAPEVDVGDPRLGRRHSGRFGRGGGEAGEGSGRRE